MNPNKGSVVSVGDQGKISNLLKKFELREVKELKNNPKDLLYAAKLIEHYNMLQETGGHLVQRFQPNTPLSIDHYPRTKIFFDATGKFKEVLFRASNRYGKALPDWELVLTPKGFVPIGDLVVGDSCIGSDGLSTPVIGVYPQGKRSVYKLTLNNGECLFADEEHLWAVRDTKKGAKAKFETLTTDQMVKRSNALWALPKCPSVEFTHNDIKIDPYLMGILLGDGGLSNNSIRFTTADAELLDSFTTLISAWGLKSKKYGEYDYGASSELRCRKGWNLNPLLESLKELNCDTISLNKHIPTEYKINSKEVRLGILQGLMDTDGYVDAKGNCIFYSVSRQLADDVTFIARSLGLHATIKQKLGKYKGQPHYSWAVFLGKSPISLFRLTRKKQRQSKPVRPSCQTIHKIELHGEEPCTCIEVASVDHLFIMNKFALTHNTESGAYAATCWATGLYPDWWTGRVFNKQTYGWVAGDTNDTVRTILQDKMLGTPHGTGLIPKDLIEDVVTRPNTGGTVDTIFVRHKPTNKISRIKYKTYQSGPDSFYGAAPDYVWMDEEPTGKDAQMIYNQCYIRLLTTNGNLIITFTPLMGWTPLLKDFTESATDLTPQDD